ncbi:MAG TPA: hypothetical protein VL240_00415 [Candidatus Binatia bacterium]|nr:hypothetical protein [Candidatus Binatia bacterium]
MPRTEVDLILVNSEPVGFTCLVRSGDRISVYPAFTSLEVSSLLIRRPSGRGGSAPPGTTFQIRFLPPSLVNL